MTINYHTLPDGTADQMFSYKFYRYKMLLAIEEGGIEKQNIYADSVGIATVGCGFNLRQPRSTGASSLGHASGTEGRTPPAQCRSRADVLLTRLIRRSCP